MKGKVKAVSNYKTNEEAFSFASFPTLPNVGDYPRRVKEMVEELKKFQEGDGYFVSVDNGSSNYNIHSKGLKNCLRNIIFSDEFWKNKNEGQRFTEGSFFSYKEGVNDEPDIFKVEVDLLENEIIPPQIQGTNSSQIVEIDDEEAEKIHQEKLEKKGSKIEKKEINKVENDKKIKQLKDDGKININQDDNNRGKGNSKYIIPFVGVSLLFCAIIGITLKVKN